MSKERNKLKKQLDEVFSKYIRLRDNNKCIVCGKEKSEYTKIQNGHLFSRKHMSTRYDEKNCNAQCAGCNLLHNMDFEPYLSAWLGKYGEEELVRLTWRKQGALKLTASDLRILIKEYRKKIKEF